jgi:Cobalamin synthesis protein cobW C-terminal domain.
VKPSKETIKPENNNQVYETEKQEEIKFHFNRNKTTMKTITLKNVTLPTPVHLMMILDLVVGGVFGNIPRAKGYVNCHTKKEDGSPEWIRFDLVNQKWQMTGFDPQKQASLTFIGNDINEEDLKEYFTILDKKKTENKPTHKKINFLKDQK